MDVHAATLSRRFASQSQQKLEANWLGLESFRGRALFVTVHILLGWLAYQSDMISTLHALLTVALALQWALRGKAEYVLGSGAYIVGAEVLWRMTGAHVFWEFGKYSLALVLLVSLFRERRTQMPLLPLLVWLRAFHSIYNPMLAVEVLARLLERHPDARLTMVGPGKGDGSFRVGAAAAPATYNSL